MLAALLSDPGQLMAPQLRHKLTNDGAMSTPGAGLLGALVCYRTLAAFCRRFCFLLALGLFKTAVASAKATVVAREHERSSPSNAHRTFLPLVLAALTSPHQ